MVVLVVILVCAYVALDFYTGGQQNASMVEGAVAPSSARCRLQARNRQPARFRGETDAQVPPALARCPNGQPYAYKQAGGEYTLTCQDVLFKSKPYQYDSKSRAWGG